jgi:ABC-type amino acid transport substrate-binding protein
VKRALAALLAAALLASATCDAFAADPKRTVRIGYREGAAPFSYLGADGIPQGYSIDLCLAIAKELGQGVRPDVAYVLVTPESRLDYVIDRRIDLECGATSATDERRARVDFSPVIFVAGTRLLVKRGSALHSLRDLAGKTIVTVTGTTNSRAMVNLAAGRVHNVRSLAARSYEEAFSVLDSDAASAMAADDILLSAFMAERGLADRYIMVGDPLTHEAYGIAFPKGDVALAKAVQSTFGRLAASGELARIYERWFVEPLPSGSRLGVPMNALLEKEFRGLGMPGR